MRRSAGHIRERSAGSFELRYSLGTDPATGRRKIATATVRGSRKDAEKELRRLLRSLDTGEHVDPTRVTVRQWLTTWLATVRGEVSSKTHERYSAIVHDRLVPAFGNLPISKLTPADIQRVYTAWAIGGRRDGKPGPLAAQSRRLIHRVLNAALNRAVELQVIARNPAQVIRKRLPKDERSEMATLTPEQSQQLLAETTTTPLYWPILLSLATGARRGEVLALRWRNVNLDRGTARIVENLVWLNTGLEFKSPKGGRGRTVTLPRFAIEELRRRKREQAEELLRLGVRQIGDTLVCARSDGSPILPNVLTNYFRRVADRLYLPVHFHSLRHTHATQLLLAGVHPKVAQERLGHATVAMTLDIYSHVTEQLHDDAAAKIDEAFRGRRVPFGSNFGSRALLCRL
jgi:integrase